MIAFINKKLKELKHKRLSMNGDIAVSTKDFNIASKQLISKISCHDLFVACLCKLDDGRLVSASRDHSIIIYNKITFKPDLIIKEHKRSIKYLIKIYKNKLVSCSDRIRIFKIIDNNYEVAQFLDYHKESVNKIIELKNNNLVSCSENDNSIIFYSKKDDDKYEKYYQISTNDGVDSIVQTKESEICYSIFIKKHTDSIVFYDLSERKTKKKINGIQHSGFPFNMITKNLLIIGGNDMMFIINVDVYQLVRKVEIRNHGWYNGFCKLSENMFLTGGSDGIIRQWKIKGDDISLIYQKEKAHDGSIYALIRLPNGKIGSSSIDNSIKIWSN